MKGALQEYIPVATGSLQGEHYHTHTHPSPPHSFVPLEQVGWGSRSIHSSHFGVGSGAEAVVLIPAGMR